MRCCRCRSNKNNDCRQKIWDLNLGGKRRASLRQTCDKRDKTIFLGRRAKDSTTARMTSKWGILVKDDCGETGNCCRLHAASRKRKLLVDNMLRSSRFSQGSLFALRAKAGWVQVFALMGSQLLGAFMRAWCRMLGCGGRSHLFFYIDTRKSFSCGARETTNNLPGPSMRDLGMLGL